MMDVIFWKVIVPGGLILCGVLGIAIRTWRWVVRRNERIRPWE